MHIGSGDTSALCSGCARFESQQLKGLVCWSFSVSPDNVRDSVSIGYDLFISNTFQITIYQSFFTMTVINSMCR
jgi:hypothetical protein